MARRLRAAGHQAITLPLPGLADGDSPTGLHLSDTVDYVFAARLGLAPVMVPGGHESMVTHPDEVAKAVLAA